MRVAIRRAVGMPITSKSANLNGRPVARNANVLRRLFGGLVDFTVPGRDGPATGASGIRHFESGRIPGPGGT